MLVSHALRYFRKPLIVSRPRYRASPSANNDSGASAGANLEISSIPTFVFPVFASYKALKTSDPALLTPWLMYWVVLACALLVESWVGFILVW